jgi:ADP-heptose:LPS heptosyltransferase
VSGDLVGPNPNQYRRPGPGILLALARPVLAILLIPFRRRREGPPPRESLHVFQAYQVGDFYMALPAVRLLARHMPVTVLGRPDCLFALAGAGAAGLPFANPFFSDSSPGAFLRGVRAALALRKRLPRGGTVIDLESDPRSALLLRIAGFHRVVGYEGAHAAFFDVLLPLPAAARHQGAKGEAVAEAFLRSQGIDPGSRAAPAPAPGPTAPGAALLLSCFTRKDTKNWPLASWDVLITSLLEGPRPVRILVPPDGDAGFAAFRSRWEGRVEFLSGDLPAVEAAVDAAAGIIATDNFIGHMAASRGKPVLWINGSSDPELVAPRGGPTTVVQVDPMPCRPCSHRCVNPVYKRCLLDLTPEAVLAAARPWLASLA